MNSPRRFSVAVAPSLALALALVSSAALVTACGGSSESSSSSSSSLRSVDDDYAKMVGRWQFVYDDARRASVEADLAKKYSDPAELAAAKKDAEDEAASSTIELTADREYKSMIGTEVVLDDRCTKLERGPKAGSVSCTPDSWIHRIVGGKPTMRLDGDELVMTDPRKGDLHFRRIAK